MRGIYKLVWSDCDYFYIGQSNDITERFKDHVSQLFNGKHSNKRICRCYKKYGLPILEVLQECNDEISLIELECKYISLNRKNINCLNFYIDRQTKKNLSKPDNSPVYKQAITVNLNRSKEELLIETYGSIKHALEYLYELTDLTNKTLNNSLKIDKAI